MNSNYNMETDYTGIIFQWLFLFALLAVPFVSGWFFGMLARRNNRERWVFFIVGVTIFFAGHVIGAQLDGLLLQNFGSRESGNLLSGFLRIPFAILVCIVSYFIFKRSWTKI